MNHEDKNAGIPSAQSRTHRLKGLQLLLLLTALAAVTSVCLLHAGIPAPARPLAAAQRQIVPAPTHIEIASTTAERALGLGGRANIPDDYGMLFIFQTKDNYGFWMKGMLVPIDMIFLKDDGTIVNIAANAQPASYPSVFYPNEPVHYVLEVQAGYAAAHGLAPGVRITGLPLGDNVSK